tara:strand:+ start:4737 stop:5309 length:573 start_codon:yes stop_codon:yes gene_type:complete
MNDQDRKRFKEVMIGIADLYDKEITSSKATLYFEMLSDLTIEQFESAVKAHCRDIGKEGSFFPKPADIIRQVKKAGDDEAEIAWVMLMDDIKRNGYYSKCKLTDGISLACIQAIGGYKNLTSITYSEIDKKRAEFIKLYGIYSTMDIKKIPSNLPGFTGIVDERRKKQISKSSNVKKITENKDNPAPYIY